MKESALQPPSDAVRIIRKAIEQLESDEEWVPLSVIGKQLSSLASDFDPRTYGFRKLSDLVRETKAFDMKQPKGGALRIRGKPRGKTR